MTDMLENGVNWLSDQLKAHASRAVTIKTPAGDLEDLLVTLGKSDVEEMNQSGVVTRVKLRDYLVDVADLVLDDAKVIPTESWRIVDGGLICQPLPLGDEGVFEYSDPYRKRMRIHTKVLKDST